MYVYKQPKVTPLSVPSFVEPASPKCQWVGTATPAERLAEFAGRVCYMSYSNPANRSTKEYISNILLQGHGSVLEHANFSLLFEGVSRSLTHELVRHRAGFAYSQLSQRYVDESDVGVVMPPAIQDSSIKLQQAWIQTMLDATEDYRELVLALQSADTDTDSTMKKKRAREAARSVLPNATETKIVVTANARAWRHFLELRGGLGADREIRALAFQVRDVLAQLSPNLFGDLVVIDGEIKSTLGAKKV